MGQFLKLHSLTVGKLTEAVVGEWLRLDQDQLLALVHQIMQWAPSGMLDIHEGSGMLTANVKSQTVINKL